MGLFFIYIIKSAVCLALLYLFFCILLSRETFHKLNRFALLSLIVLSFAIPSITVKQSKPMYIQQSLINMENDIQSVTLPQQEESKPLDSAHALLLIYFLGILLISARDITSFVQLKSAIRRGERKELPGGIHLILSNDEIAPFSWMHYIVLSKKDYDNDSRLILMHEMAHIRMHHSWDLLLTDLCILLQWFNPAAWLLRRNLQSIHEYEADEAVLEEGVDAKQYQLLLIKKAVGTRLYSMANSFNHSSLINRITMMLKDKSNPWARMKYLYVLPLAAIAVAAFARPEIASESEAISNVKVNDFESILKENGTSNETSSAAAVLPQKKSTDQKAKDGKTVYAVVEHMPEFPGGQDAVMKYLARSIKYPKEAEAKGIEGTVICRFIVNKDGTVSDAIIVRGVDPILDKEVLRVVQSMPKWKAGIQKGKTVNVYYTVPIVYRNSKAGASTQTSSNDKIFAEGDALPEFPGGQSGLLEYVRKEMKYPDEAKAKGIQGKVICRFVVNKEGEVQNVAIVRGIDPALDKEAVRIINAMPQWKPAKVKGKAADVPYTIPIDFKIS
jgi:TonB family protein